ncbi:hypothetical protein [Compostimonas suwonensis]|uniref:FtsX-like permease family protein n=1 Tax=Compostimonas suwonensis TaxID=1048394 RepID=A0A2M9BZZ2_9MICO|nr:hypothetical protein [Compostimonas suwonensis]PJJ63663.1 hypothetical protein CLV54_1334 [Compostimonas suwonensis]
MKVTSLLRETCRNILSGTTRTALFAGVFGLIALALLVADVTSVRQIVASADRFQSSGASVMTIVAEGRIDGTVCESFNHTAGVRSAGAIRDPGAQLRVAALPGNPLPLREVSPSFPAILTHKKVPSGGLFLEVDAAKTLGLRIGSTLVSTSGAAPIAGIYAYPADGRRQGLGYAALEVATDHRAFDECWIDGWPQLSNAATLLLTAVIPSNDASEKGKPLLGQLNPTLGTTFDGAQRFSDRVSRLAAPVGALAGLALGYVSVRLRRIELASALHSGVGRIDMCIMITLEAASWIVPVVVVGFAVSASLAVDSAPEDWGRVLLIGVRIPVLAAAASFTGAGLALAMTRERHLFRYFKDR